MDEHELDEQPKEEPREQEAESAEEQQAPQSDSPRDDSAEMEQAEEAAEIETRDELDEPASDQEPAPVEVSEPPQPSEEPVKTSAEEEEAEYNSFRTRERRREQMIQGEIPPETSTEPAWYVIHCYSGYENKVRHNLEQRIETMGMKDKIFDVVIPTQEEIEVREGKRRTVERHIFPGYVLVNMSLSEESWYVVRNTPGVTGFVGMGNLPTALRPEEVSQIIKRMEAEAPTVKVSFKEGERVRIIDGPFNDFRGTVAEIDMERTKVRVMVSFFGRETPVELDFLQVEKA